MKSEGFLGILTALIVVNALGLLSCRSSMESEPVNSEPSSVADTSSADTGGGPPPLVVNMDTPLLLDEPTEEEAIAANTEAAIENSACFVCHANYMTESLAGRHADVNIGCVHCHGESTAHRNDENNTTPPEIMYPSEKINAYCQACHSTAHDIPPRTIIARRLESNDETIDESSAKVIARWKERGLDKTKADPGKIVCTDCHGDHRMKVRTVIWDKKSGELLRTNRGDF
jgi:hypothetical protein